MNQTPQEPTATALADLLPIAQRFLELQQEHGGMLVDVVDQATRRLFESDGDRTKPYAVDVLRLVAGAISLANFYGYSLEKIPGLWNEWIDGDHLSACATCGLEHERRTGCPPQERRTKV